MSSNGHDFTADGHLFDFLALPVVTALEPTSGPVFGGTRVAAFGHNFSPRAAALSYLLCRFNASSSLAIWRSETMLHCVSPRMQVHGHLTLPLCCPTASCLLPTSRYHCMSPLVQTGVAAVEVANTPPAFSASRLSFEYVPVYIASMSPLSGPLDGGTQLTLTGSGFLPAYVITNLLGLPKSLVVTYPPLWPWLTHGSYTLGHLCVFDGLVSTVAHAVSTRVLVCQTPATANAATTSVRLSLDGSEVKVLPPPPLPISSQPP